MKQERSAVQLWWCGLPGAVRFGNRIGALGKRSSVAQQPRQPQQQRRATKTDLPLRFCDAAEVFTAYEQGDACADSAVNEFCEKLGFALAQLACLFDPEIILLGGGLSVFFPLYAEPLRRAFAREVIPVCRETRIEAAALGNTAGVAGTARLAMLAHNDSAIR